jgi:hypothetical protein
MQYAIKCVKFQTRCGTSDALRASVRSISSISALSSRIESARGLLDHSGALPYIDGAVTDVRYKSFFRTQCSLPGDVVELDNELMQEGLLLEDVLSLDKLALDKIESVHDLKKHLYGESSLPIPKNPTDESSGVLIRRQFAIERLVNARSIIEYRLFAQSMSSMGLLGSVKDLSVGNMWSTWLDALSMRIESHFSSSTPLESFNEKNSQNAATALGLLRQTNLTPTHIANIACVTAIREVFSSSGQASTGRGSAGWDDTEFDLRMHSWTNYDIESSITKSGSTDSPALGRCPIAKLCDIMGSAIAYEALVVGRGKDLGPVSWSTKDRFLVGSELTRMLISECYFMGDLSKLKMHDDDVDSIEFDPYTQFYITSPTQKKIQIPTTTTLGYMHAFSHVIENRGMKSTGYLALDPQLIDRLANVVPSAGFLKLLPLVFPPLGWGQFWSCGYLTRRVPIVRPTGSKDASRDYDMTPALDRVRSCLDYLGSTKWKVEGRVLAWVEQALEGEHEVPGIPRKTDFQVSPSSSTSSKSERRADLVNQLRMQQKQKNELPILLSKLEIARDFKNAKNIYFPHSIDFRGRCYPVPAPFNHQGDDVVRSLLRFGESKVLGDRGWFWLKVHCANVFGQDKRTLDQRVEWVAQNMEMIIKVGSDPLGNIHWVDSLTSDFWQAVSACSEIACAVSHDSGPENFPSNLPIQQDGSCNGLQHYAALGRDRMGAVAVNVVPSDKVEDVYMYVLDIVRERVAADAKLADPGTPFPKRAKDPKSFPTLAQTALSIDGILQRKTVKQTVMTICYGVTQMGAAVQIQKQLNDLPEVTKRLKPGQIAVLSQYLARITLESIDTVFSRAMAIKRWFDQVAAQANKHKVPINWMSPSGVPCRQPYRRVKKIEVRTPLQKLSVINDQDFDKAPISTVKQRMGFPPNFVHSLDASHMVLTALRCKELGITFAAVHDSFWTHACDVDVMNTAIREEFLEMHSEPILQRLRDAIVMSLGAEGKHVPPLPKQGKLDLKGVLNSKYFFD